MKLLKYYQQLAILGCACLLSLNSCTNLDEEPYDVLVAETYIQSKGDVIRDFLRSFEHGFWSVQNTYTAQENSSDEMMTPNRQGDWQDGGKYARAHNHDWTPTDDYIKEMWDGLYQGVCLATNSLEDIQVMDAAKYEYTEAQKADFIAELRVHRAWFHLRLFDAFRNIEIITKVKGEIKGKAQATPQETFDFIESEILSSINDLPTRESIDTTNAVGRWTKGAAMSLLARLYLNAHVYIGQDKYTECQTVCQDIIDGKYGHFELENRWDAPFDYNNALSSENIFVFASSFAYTHWHYGTPDGGIFWWGLPYNVNKYLDFTDLGTANPKYALQPGRDIQGNELPGSLGKPFVKFQKYSDDIRLKLYKNLGSSKREGMFLFGQLTYMEKGLSKVVTSTRGYNLYLRDQVGYFLDTPAGVEPADKVSNMDHADQNSGIPLVKYPFYASSDVNKFASAYAEIRLAEIYYSLAECQYRLGNKDGAAISLNKVRARYYPVGSPSLYANGSVLNDQEMLDEWGREFVGEGRRRTDMIRWGVFSTGSWWDKTPDADNHTEIFPLAQGVLDSNPLLKQNSGY